MTEFEYIEEKSGQPSHSCNCEGCQAMCKRCPCLGTPDDIKALIDNGYIHQLVLTKWSAGYQMGIPAIDMVQLQFDDNGCVLFKDGLCTIHHTGLKPTEGKLASHATYKVTREKARTSPVALVAVSWLASYNRSTVEWIEKAMLRYLKIK